MRIGVFDSGIGGINVLSCLIKKYPHNEYIYFGDTKNLPYGDKNKKELFNFQCNLSDSTMKKVDRARRYVEGDGSNKRPTPFKRKPKYDSKKLRYGRLAICTDADSDGYHIGLLIMAALAYLAPGFIKEGRLCWLRSPLYIVNNKAQAK